MDNELRNVIRQADQYIKAGNYQQAWKTLLPYQKQPEARKRLIWLKKKNELSKQKKAALQQQQKRNRSRLAWVGVIIATCAIGSILILLVATMGILPGNQPATNVEQALAGTKAADTEIPVFPSPTLLPSPTPFVVTENPVELTLQVKAAQQLAALTGVSEVISLDIDMPVDEPPLVYIELVVVGENNTIAFVDSIKQLFNDLLKVTEYSDFGVIISNEQGTVEYIYDMQSNSWISNSLSNAS